MRVYLPLCWLAMKFQFQYQGMFIEVVGDGNGDVSMVAFPREEKGVVVFEFQLTPCSTDFMFLGKIS